MVLLTSSTISVAISGAVICAFTFLLFLSGYVLQQRTVRSLQEALRQPPEPKPIPTLPPQFASPTGLPEHEDAKVEEVIVNLTGTEVGTASGLASADVAAASDNAGATDDISPSQIIPENFDSLAYVLSLPNPEDLCSAALFAQQQRQSSNLPRKPSIIFLYPATWETDPSPLNIAALSFLRDIHDEYDLIYHPVDISTIWTGVGINSQLLGELQRNRWDFDRILYLKSPGMAMDTLTLDKTLQSSSVKTSWAPVSASAGHDPEVLFWSRKRGLMMPRGEMRRLTMSAVTRHSDHHAEEMEIEVWAKSAAYVLFDGEELKHRRSEKEWYDGLFEKFERGRSSICKDRGLLPGEQDKVDLRRRV